MAGLTAAVATIGVLAVLMTRPVYGLVVYLGVIMLYPDRFTLSIGTIDITAARVVVTVLLVRCLANASLVRQFRWRLLDTLVAVSMVVYATTLAFTTPFEVWLENRCGFLVDTFFAYLAVRLVIVDRRTFVTVAKSLALITLLLAVVAVTETLTKWSPYMALAELAPASIGRWGSAYPVRAGLFRAKGSCNEPIMLGLMFATMIPLIWLLRHEPRPWKWLCKPLAAAAILGVLATISSGPYVASGIILSCLFLERCKHLVKPLLVMMVVGCVALEVISNRHFYDPILDRLAFDAGNAWYRSELFEVAIRKLPEYWTVGYGYTDPGWGPMIDGRTRTDGVNDYVVHAILYGVPGLLAFISVLTAAMHNVIRTHATVRSRWLRSCAWSLGSALAGLMFAFWSVALFTQMVSVFYVLLGMHGAVSCVVGRRRDHRRGVASPATSLRQTKGPVGVTPGAR